MEQGVRTKILIAEDGRGNCDLIEKHFKKSTDLEISAITADGSKILDIIKEKSIDVVIMDLILPGLDGLSVLDELQTANIEKKPKVIVLSALSHDTFVNQAMSLGASFFMAKPFDAKVLEDRVREVIKMENKITSDTLKQAMKIDSEKFMPQIKDEKIKLLEEKITNIFITVGIPPHVKGYQFLREAIKMAVYNPEIINSITKRLYPNIAERFSTSSSKVERAIRHAIEVAWNRGKIENINNIFGIKIYNSSDKPTNGEFIALVADKMLLEGA